MTSRRRIFAAALLATVLGCGGDTEEPPVIGVIWEDDFDGPAGQLPDPAKWRFDEGTGWGNNQLEWDTDRPENVSLDGNGNLAITAREESFAGRDYTSGRIKTQDLFERRYGRFEARIKLPIGQGIWPAFWLLGADFPDVGWPACGEIDVMEYLGHEPRSIHGTLHGPGYSGGNAIGREHSLAQGGFHLGFHTFAIAWSPESIVWEVDGFVYHTVAPSDLPGGARWVFDHPFFILLNVAVGGYWPGYPDETTEFPQVMLVDYVRVTGELD